MASLQRGASRPALPVHLPRFGWTADRYDELPDDDSLYEIIDGELCVMSPPSARHQWLCLDLHRELDRYAVKTGIGEALFGPGNLYVGPTTVLMPDLFVVPPAARAAEHWREFREVLLVVEVLSRSTARRDRTVKRRHYQRFGVCDYWVVDGRANVLEWYSGSSETPRVIRDALSWQPQAGAEPLVLDVAALFARNVLPP